MDEEEHEVYGQEIPEDGDMDGADVDMTGAGDDAAKVPPLWISVSRAKPNPISVWISDFLWVWLSCRSLTR